MSFKDGVLTEWIIAYGLSAPTGLPNKAQANGLGEEAPPAQAAAAAASFGPRRKTL